MSKSYRKTYAEINLSNIMHNYNEVQKRIPNTTVIPVVKANAYGHGAIKVTEHLLDNNVTVFAVSLLEEALELRKVFKDIDILVMGVLDYEGFRVAALNRITVTCSNFDQVKDLMKIKTDLKVHLKLNTGMNRLGFNNVDVINKVLSELSTNDNIDIHGIYTHFSTADCDYSYYVGQKELFEKMITEIPYNFGIVHVSNSSSSIKYEKDIDYTTHSRLGISLYGLTLDEGMDFLKPAYKLITRVSEIKHVKRGDKIGYGATYTASDDEIIGVLPLGYADGFIRKNQGGYVEINGNKYEIVGRVCMDQMFIRIDASITKNDDVIVFGGLVSIDDVANRLETINYEVVCQITSRVPKIYIK